MLIRRLQIRQWLSAPENVRHPAPRLLSAENPDACNDDQYRYGPYERLFHIRFPFAMTQSLRCAAEFNKFKDIDGRADSFGVPESRRLRTARIPPEW